MVPEQTGKVKPGFRRSALACPQTRADSKKRAPELGALR